MKPAPPVTTTIEGVTLEPYYLSPVPQHADAGLEADRIGELAREARLRVDLREERDLRDERDVRERLPHEADRPAGVRELDRAGLATYPPVLLVHDARRCHELVTTGQVPADQDRQVDGGLVGQREGELGREGDVDPVRRVAAARELDPRAGRDPERAGGRGELDPIGEAVAHTSLDDRPRARAGLL